MVVVLSMAGDQVPEILFVEIIGKATTLSPTQIAGIGLNVGVTAGFTKMVKVWVVAHWPAFGVKVYVVVAALLIAGDHVPIMLLRDVVGNSASGSPIQI